MALKKYKRDRLKELWTNRPWAYIPAVIQYMKWYPYKKSAHSSFKVWLRNCLYVNWQKEWKEDK